MSGTNVSNVFMLLSSLTTGNRWVQRTKIPKTCKGDVAQSTEIIWSFLWNFLLLLYWQLQYLRIDFHQDALYKIIICTHSWINSSIFDSFISKSFIQKNIHTSQCYLCSSGLGPTLIHLSQSLGKSEFAWRFSHVHWVKLN